MTAPGNLVHRGGRGPDAGLRLGERATILLRIDWLSALIGALLW